MTTTAYPLCWPDGWPRSKSRKEAQFKKYRNRLSVHDGIGRVLSELAQLHVRRDDCVISTNVQTRMDGFPRSDRGEPQDPGVAVYWQKGGKGQTKVMAIDRYNRVADNLAAVAATLEAMRAIERHGGAQILERAFTGFTALAAPKSCWEILGLTPGSGTSLIETRFRELARVHHPDVGGDHGRMAEISAARDEAVRQAAR